MDREKIYFIKLIRLAINGTVIENIPRDLDWEEIYRLAEAHDIIGVISEGINKLSAEQRPDNKFVLKMYKRLINKNLTKREQEKEYKRIIELLEKKKIKNYNLKIGYAEKIYNKPFMRMSNDIDLFIKPCDLERAIKAVEEEGYKIGKKIDYHISFEKIISGKGKIELELHTALVNRDMVISCHLNDYYNNAVLVNEKKYTYCFCTEDIYIYNVIHYAKHFINGEVSIKHLIDLYLYNNIYSSVISAKYVRNRLKKLGFDTFERKIYSINKSFFDDKQVIENDVIKFILGYMVRLEHEACVWLYSKICEKGNERKDIYSILKMKNSKICKELEFRKKQYEAIRQNKKVKCKSEMPFIRKVKNTIKPYIYVYKNKGYNIASAMEAMYKKEYLFYETDKKFLDDIECLTSKEDMKKIENLFAQLGLLGKIKFKH